MLLVFWQRQSLVKSIVFHLFWPKLTHPAGRFVCDSWATCSVWWQISWHSSFFGSKPLFFCCPRYPNKWNEMKSTWQLQAQLGQFWPKYKWKTILFTILAAGVSFCDLAVLKGMRFRERVKLPFERFFWVLSFYLVYSSSFLMHNACNSRMLSSAGASLNEPPPPKCSNWPSVFWRPF